MIKQSRYIVVMSFLLSTHVLAQTWNIEIVDSVGSVGRFNSIAIDNQDYPHISYYDWTNHDLKYATWAGSDWELETVDSIGMVGRYNSLVLDPSGLPRIAYFDYPDGGLKYASWNGSSWEIDNVDSACSERSISLALDTQGNPHISYWDTSGSLRKVMHAYRAGSSWETEVVLETSTSIYYSNSLAIDDYDVPHLAYSDNEGLNYAFFNGSAWETQVIDASCEGSYASLDLDSQGNPCIAYVDQSYFWEPTLKYTRWNGSSWIVQNVRELIAPTEDTSLALDSDDNPHISYTYAWDGSLTYTYWTGSEWTTFDVDTTGNIAYDTSIELDSVDNPHFSYFDMGMDDLRYACLDITGISGDPDQSGFSLISVSPNPSRGNVLVSFSLPEASQVSFSLFDAAGRLVQHVHSGFLPDGISSVALEQLSTGLFFCRMTAGEFSATQRFVVIQ
jgi:hypothetical protein